MNTKTNKQQRPQRQLVPGKTAAASQFDRSMSSQLRGLLTSPSNRVVLRDSIVVAANLPPLETVGDDGDLHINVSKNAQTNLGKLLAMESPLICKAENVGTFASMLGFWYFLSCPTMPRFAALPGNRVHQVSRQEKALLRNMDNVRVYVAHHMWKTIQAYPEVADALAACELDFDSYVYVFSEGKTLRTRINSSNWWVLVLYRIRQALQKGFKYPDFYELKPNSCPQGTGTSYEVTEKQFQYYINRFVAPHAKLPLTDVEQANEVHIPQPVKQGKKKKDQSAEAGSEEPTDQSSEARGLSKVTVTVDEAAFQQEQVSSSSAAAEASAEAEETTASEETTAAEATEPAAQANE